MALSPYGDAKYLSGGWVKVKERGRRGGVIIGGKSRPVIPHTSIGWVGIDIGPSTGPMGTYGPWSGSIGGLVGGLRRALTRATATTNRTAALPADGDHLDGQGRLRAGPSV